MFRQSNEKFIGLLHRTRTATNTPEDFQTLDECKSHINSDVLHIPTKLYEQQNAPPSPLPPALAGSGFALSLGLRRV